MNRLVLSDVHKSFGTQPVLRGLDLEVKAGSFAAVLGPSGSGKTTLLRLVAGFERPDKGTISIGTTVLNAGGRFVPPEHRGIGYVPQEGALFPNLTVERNAGFGLHRGADRANRVAELLEMVGMADMAKRYPHELSGGQQQRVALARALAIDPKVVLLDEPFSSLDASLRQAVREDVADVLRQAGTTTVLVTHDQDEALSMADHVAVIDCGRVTQFDTPERLYAHPDDPEVARFVGESNLVSGKMEGRAVRTAFGLLALCDDPGGNGAPADGTDTVVLIRPEQLELHQPAPASAPDLLPGLVGRVVDYQFYGHDAVVRVATGQEGAPPEVVVRVTGSSPWPAGAPVGVTASGPVVVWEAATFGSDALPSWLSARRRARRRHVPGRPHGHHHWTREHR